MFSNNFNIEAVEELLKNSKQLQNKIRQELSLQTLDHSEVAKFNTPEKLPLVLDTAMTNPYVDSIVAKYIRNKSSLPKKINKNIRTPIEVGRVKVKTQILQQKLNKEETVTDSLLSFYRTSSVHATEVAGKSPKLMTTRPRVPPKRITTKDGIDTPINSSKITLESNKLLATSSYRLPLQRFAESATKDTDFSQEHPDLELEMTSEQTTLFPRRFYKTTECFPQNEECINVVEAEVKPPPNTPLMQDTWNGILMQNKPKGKSLRKKLKKTKGANVKSTLKCPDTVPQDREPKSYDIISSVHPSKGTFTLMKHSEALSKQKKCHLQTFPVLYIRPECRVQKVASISIRGESKNILGAFAAEHSTRNVKYLECSHKNECELQERSFDLEIGSDRVRLDVKEKDESKESNTRKENKFFKALEFKDHFEYSTTNSASSPANIQSSASNLSFSSSSSSSPLKNSSPTKTINEIHHSLESCSNSPTRIIKNPVSRREVHVQTENNYKKNVSTNTSPSPTEVITSVKSNCMLNKMSHLNKIEHSVEEDIIAKIFERIRNDLPDALELYANRNTFTNITTSPSKEPHIQEQKNSKHQNRAPTLNDKYNVKLIQRVQEKKKEVDNHSKRNISQVMPIECLSDSPKLIPIVPQEGLHKNPKTTSGLHHQKSNVESTLKKERNEYPEDAEIKRAVKIFIDSLTLDGCGGGGEKKANINDISTKRRSMTIPKSQLLSKDRFNKFTSSDSSNISNSLNGMNKMVKNVQTIRNSVRWCDISGSSTSTGLTSSDVESESNLPNDMQSLSLDTNTSDKNNTSDGEIKSEGEI